MTSPESPRFWGGSQRETEPGRHANCDGTIIGLLRVREARVDAEVDLEVVEERRDAGSPEGPRLVESLTCLGGHFQGNARMLFWSCF